MDNDTPFFFHIIPIFSLTIDIGNVFYFIVLWHGF